MKIGVVGYQGSGKSTLFQWLTGVAPDPSHAHRTQTAMAGVPEPRTEVLSDIYHAKKLTQAALEIVDTPGLSRTHEGSAAKLAMIREAGCLVVVVGSYDGSDAVSDARNLEDDLLIADLDIVSGRIERLQEQMKKPRPNRDELQKELEALEPLQAALESGQTLRDFDLSPEQSRVIRSFQLFSEKPRLIIVNTPDDDAEPERYERQMPSGTQVVAVSLGLQLELSNMENEEREEFCREMGVSLFDRDTLVRRIMDVSGQILFFTTGAKEVRAWLLRRGATAVEAAGCIHTDLAHGFIRAEVTSCDDLIRLGSEREVKANNLMHREHKEYVVQDGDVILVQHN
jgi:ribosome-binding ATPase YchF (GTP1/OBG family)